MPYRQQFRTYAECCLRAAELSDAPEQKKSLIATASAWHQLAQILEMEGRAAAQLLSQQLRGGKDDAQHGRGYAGKQQKLI
jgi:hypothetical protein